MATTGIVNGTAIGVYVGSTKVAHATDGSISINMATRDATTKDSGGWTDRLEGVRSWSITCNALFAYDATYGLSDLFSALNNRSTVTVKFSTEVTGDKAYSGTAYVTSIEANAGTEENATYSVTFEGTGALSETTIV